MWIAKIVVLLHLRVGRGGEERNVMFVQCVEVTAPLYVVENNLGSICV